MSVIYLFLFFAFVLIPYGWLSVKETKSWATFLSTERYVSITDESTMSKLSGNNWDLLCLSVLQLHAVVNKGILTSKNFTLTETKHFINRERAFQFKGSQYHFPRSMLTLHSSDEWCVTPYWFRMCFDWASQYIHWIMWFTQKSFACLCKLRWKWSILVLNVNRTRLFSQAKKSSF